MLSTLITSKTRVKILTTFLTHPDERFYYKNLIDRLGVPPSVLQSELKRFEKVGLLNSKREANIKFYSINKDFLLYPELKSIIFKTVGLADFLRDSLSKIGEIKVAFIYGSVAKNLEDAMSDIDLMVIGNVDMDSLNDAVAKAEDTLGREINFTTFDAKEWRDKLKAKKAFVTDVYKGKKIFLIGNDDELRRIS